MKWLPLALLLLATDAIAGRKFYVASNGLNSRSAEVAQTQSTPWQTPARCNEICVTGDTCQVLSTDSTLSNIIEPQGVGTLALPIVFIGDTTTTMATRHTAPKIDDIKLGVTSSMMGPKANYTSVMGFHVRNGALMGRSNGDTLSGGALRGGEIVKCFVRGGVGFWGAQECMFRENFVRGGGVGWEVEGGDRDYPNRISNMRNSVISNYFIPRDSLDATKYFNMYRSHSNYVAYNYFSCLAGISAFPVAWAMYYCHENMFYGNKRVLDVGGPINVADDQAPKRLALYMRDSSHTNTFELDTLLADESGRCGPTINSAWGMRPIDGGGNTAESNHSNKWRRCYYKMRGYIQYNGSMNNHVWEENVVATRNPRLFKVEDGGPPLTFIARNNTFYADGPIFNFNTPIASTSAIHCNIFVNYSAASCSDPVIDIPNPQTPYFWDDNIYYAFSGDSSRAVLAGSTCFAPEYTPSQWQHDRRSLWINPNFTDTTWASLNLMPASGSVALPETYDNGWVGDCANDTVSGFVGGLYTDWIAPSAVTVSLVTRLQWTPTSGGPGEPDILSSYVWGVFRFTMTGDDGDVGNPAHADIAYSHNVAITSGNFASYLLKSFIGPIQDVEYLYDGQLEANVLESGTYYFSVRVRDNQGNATYTHFSQVN